MSTDFGLSRIEVTSYLDEQSFTICRLTHKRWLTDLLHVLNDVNEEQRILFRVPTASLVQSIADLKNNLVIRDAHNAHFIYSLSSNGHKYIGFSRAARRPKDLMELIKAQASRNAFVRVVDAADESVDVTLHKRGSWTPPGVDF